MDEIKEEMPQSAERSLTQAPKDPKKEEVSEKAKEIAKSLTPDGSNGVDNFGLALQGYMKNLDMGDLNKTRVKNAGEMGEQLVDLSTQLKFDGKEKPKNIFDKMLSKFKKASASTAMRYQTTDKAITNIQDHIVKSRDKLQHNLDVIGALREDNQKYCETLTDYINGGQIKLDEVRNEILPKLKKEVAQYQEGTPEKRKAVHDLQEWMDFADTLDKRVYDLRLAQHISLQTEPQLRLIYLSTKQIITKSQEAIDITVPAWRRMMATNLQMQDLKDAQEGVKSLTDAMTHVLNTNSQMVKDESAAAFKEANRGIVDEDAIRNGYKALEEAVQLCHDAQQAGVNRRENSSANLQQMFEDYQNNVGQISDVDDSHYAEIESDSAKTDTDNKEESTDADEYLKKHDNKNHEDAVDGEFKRFDPSKF